MHAADSPDIEQGKCHDLVLEPRTEEMPLAFKDSTFYCPLPTFLPFPNPVFVDPFVSLASDSFLSRPHLH